MRATAFGILGILAAMTLPLNVDAQSRWLYVYASNADSVALDTQSVESRVGGEFVIWTRWMYARPGTEPRVPDATAFMQRYVLQCVPMRSQIIALIAYDSAGTKLDGEEWEEGSRPWRSPAPESIGEAVFKRSCEHLAAAKPNSSP